MYRVMPALLEIEMSKPDCNQCATCNDIGAIYFGALPAVLESLKLQYLESRGERR
jgi:hypothetical protein